MSLQSRKSAGLDQVMTEVLNAHRALLLSDDLSAAVMSVLGKVGAAAGVDRVYIFEIHNGSGVALASQRYEWVADGIAPQLANHDLQNLPLREAGYSRWLDSFLAFRPVYGNISEFPETERPTLRDQGILSLLILPVFVSGTLWGFVGFDDCTCQRAWCDAELDLLFALTITLGQVLCTSQKSDADAAAVASISLVGSMLTVHAATLSETPMDALVERTRARLGATVGVHRYFAEHGCGSSVNARQLFDFLLAHFSDIHSCSRDQAAARRIDIEIAPLEVAVSVALNLVMIVTEVVATLSERCEEGAQEGPPPADVLTISLAAEQRRAALVISARGNCGVPQPLDGMAHMMLRQLIEKLNATLGSIRNEGELLRLCVPL